MQCPRHWWQSRTLLLSAAMIPLLWSSLCALRPAASSPLPPAEARPPLAFDQYSVNLRRVPLQPVLEGIFRFENRGTRPVTITKLDPSCGCLKPRLTEDKTHYEPGEVGHFVVQVATANEEPGPHEYTIRVLYEDEQPHESAVRFKLTLPVRKVTVEPSELGFFQLNGQPASRTVYVTDYRGNEISLTGARCSSEQVSLKIGEPEFSETGHPRVPVEVSVPGNIPSERAYHTITIETSDPEFSVIRIPLMLQGPRTITPAGASVIGPPER